MRRTPSRWIAAVALCAAAALPIAAPAAAAKPASARANLVKAVKTADAQAKKLIARSAACPAAAPQRAITTKVRAAQTRNLSRARPTSLRQRQLRITVHTTRLAVALTKCSGTARSSEPGSGSGSRGLDGSPGAPGADGSSSLVSALPLDVLGQALDTSDLLGGGVLPSSIPVVDLSGLATDPACAVSGTVCVGVDRDGLAAGLVDVVRDRQAELPALAPILAPLLSQVQAALAGGDSASLIDVTRTGDTTLVITAKPGSALERLTSLLGNTGGLPGISIGDIQVRT